MQDLLQEMRVRIEAEVRKDLEKQIAKADAATALAEKRLAEANAHHEKAKADAQRVAEQDKEIHALKVELRNTRSTESERVLLSKAAYARVKSLYPEHKYSALDALASHAAMSECLGNLSKEIREKIHEKAKFGEDLRTVHFDMYGDREETVLDLENVTPFVDSENLARLILHTLHLAWYCNRTSPKDLCADLETVSLFPED